MANTNNPHGLISLGYCLSGGAPTVQAMQKAVGNANRIYPGDAVARQADGSVGADSITPGTTLYSGVSLNGGAASKATEHLVIVNPDAVFETQANGAIAAVDEGLNANLVLGAGDSVTNKSGHQINAATAATTATLDVKLLKLFEVAGNDYGAYARMEVVFNKHRMAVGVAGV